MVVRYFDVIVIAKPALPRWQNPHPHANAGERPACQFARVAVVNRHVFLEDRQRYLVHEAAIPLGAGHSRRP
jgi:hypothetical protein